MDRGGRSVRHKEPRVGIWSRGGGGFRRSKGFVSLLQRDDGSFTIEKVTLAFQDLGHLLDPGLTDCRV